MSVVTEPPNILQAVDAVAAYMDRHRLTLSAEHVHALLEIRRRLERLSTQAEELIDINNRIWAKEGFDIRLNAESDTVIISHGGDERRLQLKRADPTVQIQLNAMASFSAYVAGRSEPRDDEESRLRIELEEKLESYYQSAHRVLKLFGGIPTLETIKCAAISRVRNELIEHPNAGALYSFGVGSTGPRVKPMYTGALKFNDEGLVPNTLAFVNAIVDCCRPGAS